MVAEEIRVLFEQRGERKPIPAFSFQSTAIKDLKFNVP
jgi:hypothetical protein